MALTAGIHEQQPAAAVSETKFIDFRAFSLPEAASRCPAEEQETRRLPDAFSIVPMFPFFN